VLTYSGEMNSSDCRVMGHSPADGTVLWDRALLPCIWTSVAAADVDGDGQDEIVVSGFSYDYPPFVALLGSDGALRWIRKTEEIPLWAAAGPGLVAVGGAMGTEGFVASLEPRSGEPRWTTPLPSLPDPEDPRKRRPGHSSYGAVAPAPGAVSSAGVAASTDCGQLFWIAAKDGAVAWSRTPETERVPASPRYGGGPVAISAATDTEPTAIFATQVTPYLVRTVAIAYGLDGEEKGAFELEGSVRGVAVGAAASGRRTIGAATSLGAAGFDIARR
ncbi:MAG TPA: PQQ-binding-like beta-propeller repeat protein, partial [Vulgatibacter sp.]